MVPITPSDLFGYVSISFWVSAQLPQVRTNYVNQGVQGLSLLFLAIWFVGDLCNLVGCILTEQLPFQTFLGCYFVLIDSALLAQYFYYTTLRPRRLCHQHSTGSLAEHAAGMLTRTPVVCESTPLLAHQPNAAGGSPHSPVTSRSTTLLSVSLVTVNLFARISSKGPQHELIGRTSRVFETRSDLYPSDSLWSNIPPGLLVAYVCATLYLTSRLPQIFLNFRRRSVQGLSISMFICAAMGNVTYVASILTKSTEPAFLAHALPYLIGSAGTVCLDLLIFLQWVAWGRRCPRSEIPVSDATPYSAGIIIEDNLHEV
ncbi:PQ loop repeat-domain-containing protein [Gaertneriomyces semiglobifer]|nr:PQ loop repeat-domain-containing protein [Gaertneriomyces semiglobifer]